jgi:hypothetical protein
MDFISFNLRKLGSTLRSGGAVIRKNMVLYLLTTVLHNTRSNLNM